MLYKTDSFLHNTSRFYNLICRSIAEI